MKGSICSYTVADYPVVSSNTYHRWIGRSMHQRCLGSDMLHHLPN